MAVEMVWTQAGKQYRVLRDEGEETRLKFVKYKCTVVKINGTWMVTFRDEEENRHLMHRYLTSPKDDELVSARDGNYLNLQLANLEIRKRSLVAFLKSTHVNRHGYRGITQRKRDGYWLAQIARMYIGSYKTPEEAARAFDEHAFKIFGVKINFPDEPGMTHIDSSSTTSI